MNVAMLSTLVAIVDRGSFAAAAQEVGCTPSAVSLQMKQLEAYFGQPLFDRSARTAKPTPFALEAASVARDFAGRLEALRARPASRGGGSRPAGRDRQRADRCAAAGPARAAGPPSRSHGRGLLDDSDALLADLKAGRIDAAVAGPTAVRRILPPGLAEPGEAAFRHAGAAGRAGCLAARAAAALRPDPLRSRRSPAGGSRRSMFGGSFRRRAAPWTCGRSMRSSRWSSAGLGVSIVPRPRKALLEAHRVREVPLGRGGPTRQIAVVRRRADSGHRNIDAVCRALVSAYGG